MSSKNRKKIGKSSSINWAKWHQTRIISLAEAVLLSLGRDPTGYDFFSNPLEPFPDRDPYWGFKNPAKFWFSIAMSSLDRPGGLASAKMNNQSFSDRIPYVDIRKFGEWVTKQGLSNVPNELFSDSEEMHTADGMVTYSFPYEIPFIAALEKIVRDNYVGLEPDEKPCQKKAGLELDEAMDWEPHSSRGTPSRTSASIVAKLQPEKWRSDHKRGRKLKKNI